MGFWIAAIIEDEKGNKDFYQFDNEEELRYFLAVNAEYRLIHCEKGGERR